MYKIKIIDNIINGSPNKLREKYFIKNHKDIYDMIFNYTINLDIKFPFRVWHWVYNNPNYMTCYCGKRLSPNMNWRDGYKKYCSNKCSSNSKETKDKLKKTLIEKYGVDHYSKTEDYVNKVKKTCLEKYGVDNYSKTKDYVEKSKKTYNIKYGVDNYTKTTEYLEKSKKTVLEKYGVEYPMQSPVIKEKIKQTNIKKYGETHIFKSESYRINNFEISKNANYIEYKNGMNLFSCDFGIDHNFEISTDDYYGRIRSNNKLCTVCNPIGDSQSIKEKELFEYIKSIYNGNIISNYRDRYEIDIYLPELKIGFEFNGLYWHSELFKEKNYHLDKTNYFKERGIRIIHIWEDDWTYKQDIVKSQIRNWLGLSKRVWARNCKVKEISVGESSLFLNENHIQGSDRSNKKIGLFYDSELISIMTFNKSEGRKLMKDDEWNLSRFCNKLDFSVIGGASKLLKYFIKEYKPIKIVSYADKDWSIGDIYHKLGFNLVYETNSDYKFIIDNKRVHKSRYRKSRLNTCLTESQYMNLLNIPRIWDCGKIKFVKEMI